METRPFVIGKAGLAAGAAIIAAALAFTAWGWTKIPGGARIATHWNGQGRIDGYMEKPEALATGPAMMLGLTLLFWGITKIEPRRNNLQSSRALLGVVWIGVLLIVAVGQAQIIFTALGSHLPLPQLLLAGVAILFMAMGNVLAQSRATFFVGIRTPWTLESDYSWEKTHRWTGRLFVLSGLLVLAALGFFGLGIATKVLLASSGLTAAAGIILSYIFWRQDPDRHAHDSVPE